MATIHRSRIHTMTLTCGCNVDIPYGKYRVNEPWTCNIHRALVRVKHERREWVARCTQCTYARKFGTAQITAECKGVKHALKYLHRVTMQRPDGTTYIIGTEHQKPLPDNEPPPF